MRLKALNPIKTADILITLIWEIITDDSSSEDSLRLLLNFLQLINQNDVIIQLNCAYYIIF